MSRGAPAAATEGTCQPSPARLSRPAPLHLPIALGSREGAPPEGQRGRRRPPTLLLAAADPPGATFTRFLSLHRDTRRCCCGGRCRCCRRRGLTKGAREGRRRGRRARASGPPKRGDKRKTACARGARSGPPARPPPDRLRAPPPSRHPRPPLRLPRRGPAPQCSGTRRAFGARVAAGGWGSRDNK